MSHEDQGTSYDPGARGHELQGWDKAPLELALSPGYYYLAWEVTQAAYDDIDIGGPYGGGTVVDGLCDGETNALIIVTRHEGLGMRQRGELRNPMIEALVDRTFSITKEKGLI